MNLVAIVKKRTGKTRNGRGFSQSELKETGINIEQATQPYSENIIRFSVRDEDIPLAVAAVYAEYFKE